MVEHALIQEFGKVKLLLDDTKTVVETIPVLELHKPRIESIYNNWQLNHVLPDWWAEKQAYIALGIAMIAAVDIGIDTGPMEGFDKGAVNQILDEYKLINYKK